MSLLGRNAAHLRRSRKRGTRIDDRSSHAAMNRQIECSERTGRDGISPALRSEIQFTDNAPGRRSCNRQHYRIHGSKGSA
jgi:hypothetical protein